MRQFSLRLQIAKQLIVLLVGFILFPLSLKSQSKEHGEILVSTGGSAAFIFNTFAQYSNALAGISLTHKTTLYIKKKDTQPYWKLNVYALNDNFENETYVIPINALELTIEASGDVNCEIDGTGTSTISPSTSEQTVVSGHWIGPALESTITVTITYKITGIFMPMEIGTYFNQLQFELLTHTAPW